MDGVLLDSSPIHAAAYQEALRGLAIQDFRYSRVAGMRSRDGIRAVLKENNIDLPEDQIDALAQRRARIALARIAAGKSALSPALSRCSAHWPAAPDSPWPARPLKPA